jgi:hypothetical protein
MIDYTQLTLDDLQTIMITARRAIMSNPSVTELESAISILCGAQQQYNIKLAEHNRFADVHF